MLHALQILETKVCNRNNIPALINCEIEKIPELEQIQHMTTSHTAALKDFWESPEMGIIGIFLIDQVKMKYWIWEIVYLKDMSCLQTSE